MDIGTETGTHLPGERAWWLIPLLFRVFGVLRGSNRRIQVHGRGSYRTGLVEGPAAGDSRRLMKFHRSIPVAVAILLAALPARSEIAVQGGQTLAFLGDSITQGGWGSRNGYVRLIVAGLATNGVGVKPVPAGISGHKSNQMLERLERDVLSKKPDWMTLSCGVNDVWHGEKGVPLDQYKTNIAAIVDRCQQAGVQVVLLTSTPIGENLDNANNAKLATYNDYLRSLAKEKKCRLADLSADFQTAIKARVTEGRTGNGFTTDGVHMNPAGNRVMAAGVLRALGLDDAQMKKAETFWEEMAKVPPPSKPAPPRP